MVNPKMIKTHRSASARGLQGVRIPFKPGDRVAVWADFQYLLGTVISYERAKEGKFFVPGHGLYWVKVRLDLNPFMEPVYSSKLVELLDAETLVRIQAEMAGVAGER